MRHFVRMPSSRLVSRARPHWRSTFAGSCFAPEAEVSRLPGSRRSASDPTRSLRWTLVIPESGHSSAVQQLRLGWKAEPGVAPRSGRSDCDLCLPQKLVCKVLNSICYRLEHYGTSGPFIAYHLLKYRLHPAPKPRRLLSVQLSSGYRSYQPPDVVNHRLTPRRLLQTVPYLWGSGSRWTAC
jgi:hypothetical protein